MPIEFICGVIIGNLITIVVKVLLKIILLKDIQILNKSIGKKEENIMENKEYFKGLDYEGYYDEDGNFKIDISKKDAEEVLQRLTGAKVKISE